MKAAAARRECGHVSPRDDSRFPLTSLQRAMVLASLRAPRSGAYVVQGIYEFSEELDPALLRRAWRAVVRRHEALRTCFETARGDGLFQCVLDDCEHPWEEWDWRGLAAGARAGRLEEFLKQDSQRGFDFEAGPPLRFTLIRHARQSYTLVMTRHHALYDGRSFFTIRREWFPAYDAYRRGEELLFPEPHSFREHLARLEKLDWAGARKYWGEALSGVVQTTNFVVDRIREADRFPRQGMGKVGLKLTAGQTQHIASFAANAGVDLNTLVKAAWALMLSRYSGRREIVFGVTRSCRRSLPPEAMDTIGLIVNTPPFRIDVAGEDTVASWLRKIRRSWNALREHEYTPLEKIAEWGGLPAGSPPFDTVVLYDHRTVGDVAFKPGGERPARSFTWRQGTDAALTLAAYGAPVLALDITFDPNRFHERTVAAMLGHLQTLLEEFAARPRARLAGLNMLTAEERKWLLQERNQTAAGFPRTATAHRLFEQQSARTPNKSAIEYPGGSLSYRKLNERANRIARLLREKGAAPNSLVAVCLNRSPDAVVSLLAILKAGAAFLPLHPTLPPERSSALLRDSGATLAISAGRLADKLAGCNCELVRLDELAGDIVEQPGGNLPDFADAADLAYAIYTSGSTGHPKAVGISHRSLVNHTLGASRVFDISETDRRLAFAAPGADVFVAEVFNNLCHGATLVYGLSDQGNSMQEFLRFLDDRRITITGVPSTWWREWVALLDSGRAELPAALRAVVVGMERVDPAAYLAWQRAAAGRVRWFNAYGPSEATPTATVYESGTSEFENASFVPIGKPIANTRVYVLDQAGNPLPAGIPGELYLGGEGVGAGYLNNSRLTAERFVPDPFEPASGARLYRTGDIVFSLPDGNLVYLGREDRQIKIRGFRVELDEIEKVLDRHEAVDQCAVISTGATGSEFLAAYVSAADPATTLEPEEIRSYLARRLPDHMVPAGIIALPELPRTPSGKIDRTALPPYHRGSGQSGRVFQPPSTSTEKQLAGIWRDLLGLDRVDASANFFEIGGDSLLATRLITAIDEQFGKELPLADLLRAPTLSQLAAVVDSAFGARVGAPGTPVVALQPNGSGTPFFCIAATPAAPYAFRHLARRLGENQPFFSIANPPPGGERPQRVEDLALQLCDAIRAVRPQGPYILGGYCFGGVLAVETARQLVSRGEDVRLVALLDTPAPGYPKLLRGGLRYAKELWRMASDWSPRANGRGWREIASFAGMVGRLVRRRIAGGMHRRLLGAGMDFAVSAPDGFLKLSERSSRMYTIRPIPCPVVQFIASGDELSARVLEDPRLGWRDVAARGFEVCEVAETHGVLLDARPAAELAAKLAGVFEKFAP